MMSTGCRIKGDVLADRRRCFGYVQSQRACKGYKNGGDVLGRRCVLTADQDARQQVLARLGQYRTRLVMSSTRGRNDNDRKIAPTREEERV